MVEEQGQERPGSMTELPGQDVLQALAALQVELSSEHEKNCRTYVCFMCRTNRRGSITWLGEALSCRASLASEPKL